MKSPVEGADKRVISKDKLANTLKIYRFILPYKWQFIIGMICLVVSTGVVSFIPGGFGKLIDAAIPAKDAIDQIYAVVKNT